MEIPGENMRRHGDTGHSRFATTAGTEPATTSKQTNGQISGARQRRLICVSLCVDKPVVQDTKSQMNR